MFVGMCREYFGNRALIFQTFGQLVFEYLSECTLEPVFQYFISAHYSLNHRTFCPEFSLGCYALSDSIEEVLCLLQMLGQPTSEYLSK
ncbi:hypothetical protein CEXT_312381 [Caerostris extrusa]|uniref:Uncharacterized protein n=1 Tax=Caerostris extrusa TaxID=172846 RepID=A0AAV4Y7K9_CAEEX|nr:hypothetical protein CEXT_312381 [Caerostris extrusa]